MYINIYIFKFNTKALWTTQPCQRGRYIIREICIPTANKPKRKHFWSTQPCRPRRCIKRDLQSKSILGGLQTTSAVELYTSSNQNMIQKHFWTTQPCRAGWYINRETCISTAIKTLKIPYLVYRAVSASAVYQPRPANQKYLWRRCISPARYSCISTAIEN